MIRLVRGERTKGMMEEEELRRCLGMNFSLETGVLGNAGLVTMRVGCIELIPWFDTTDSK